MFSYLIDNDDDDYNALWTMAQCTEVCRKWYLEGHHLVWRQIQLRDLLFYVRDPVRRNHYASFVEKLVFKPDDTILSTRRMADAALSFPRLHTVIINETNMLNICPENISALITPSLRSWSIDNYGASFDGTYDRDSRIYLDALLAGCGGLTQLDFDTEYVSGKQRTILKILDRIDSIEVLNLGDVAEYLADECPQEFFSKLFNKPRLVHVDFPHAVSFSQVEVDTFLHEMGRTWTMPSLKYFAKPQFDTGTAASRLISRMPNLVNLWLNVEGQQIDLDQIFITASMLEKLELLDMDLRLHRCNLDGSWLLLLTSLERLKRFALEISYPGRISLTGMQLAHFLTGLPKLEHLCLCLGSPIVSCSPEEKTAIEGAIANIKKVYLSDMTFTIQQSL